MHRRSRVLLFDISRFRHSDAVRPHFSSITRTRHTTTSTNDPSRFRRGISHTFLDRCGNDRPVCQSQRRPGARHVAVVDSPALCLFVLSPSPHVVVADHATALEYPHVTTLLQDQTIVIHNVESQEVVQTVPAMYLNMIFPQAQVFILRVCQISLTACHDHRNAIIRSQIMLRG